MGGARFVDVREQLGVQQQDIGADDELDDSSDSEAEGDDAQDMLEDFIELDDFIGDIVGHPDEMEVDLDDASSDLGAVDDELHIELDDLHQQHDKEEEQFDGSLGGVTSASSQDEVLSDSDPATPEGYYDQLAENLEAEELAAAADLD